MRGEREPMRRGVRVTLAGAVVALTGGTRIGVGIKVQSLVSLDAHTWVSPFDPPSGV